MINEVYNINGQYVTEDQISASSLFGASINKTITGCGLTTLFLHHDHVVLCVPTIAILESKIKILDLEAGLAEYDGEQILFAKGGVTKLFKTYLSTKINKIITTYDSILKVSGALGKDIADFHLVIDEYHGFVLDTFRIKSTNKVINLAKKFKDLTVMSATMPRFADTKDVFGIETRNIKLEFNDMYKSLKSVNVYPVKDRFKGIIGCVADSKAEVKIIFDNNTDDIKALVNAFCDKKVFIMTATDKQYKYEDCGNTVQDINDAEIIFCTKKGYEGWDYIKTSSVDIFAIVRPADKSRMIRFEQLKQCVGRARKGYMNVGIVYEGMRTTKAILTKYNQYKKQGMNDIQAQANTIDDLIQGCYDEVILSENQSNRRRHKANIYNHVRIVYHKGIEEYLDSFSCQAVVVNNSYDKNIKRPKVKTSATNDKDYIKKGGDINKVTNPTIKAAAKLFGNKVVMTTGVKKLQKMLDEASKNTNDIKIYLEGIKSKGIINKKMYSNEYKQIVSDIHKLCYLTQKTITEQIIPTEKRHTKSGTAYFIKSINTNFRFDTYIDMCLG